MAKLTEIQKAGGVNLSIQETGLLSLTWDVATFNDYSIGIPIKDPADDNYYINRTAVFTTTNPAADPTNWEPLLAGNHSDALPALWESGVTYAQGVFVLSERKIWQKYSTGNINSSTLPSGDSVNWVELEAVQNPVGGSGQPLVKSGLGSTEIKRIAPAATTYTRNSAQETTTFIEAVPTDDDIQISLSSDIPDAVYAIEDILEHPAGDRLVNQSTALVDPDNTNFPIGAFSITTNSTSGSITSFGGDWNGQFAEGHRGGRAVNFTQNGKNYIVLGLCYDNDRGVWANLRNLLTGLSNGTYDPSQYYLEDANGLQISLKPTDAGYVAGGTFQIRRAATQPVDGDAYILAFELLPANAASFDTETKFFNSVLYGIRYYEYHQANDDIDINRLTAAVAANSIAINSNTTERTNIGTVPTAAHRAESQGDLVAVSASGNGLEYIPRTDIIPTLPGGSTTETLDFALQTNPETTQTGVEVTLTTAPILTNSTSQIIITGSNTAYVGDMGSLDFLNNYGRAAEGAAEQVHFTGQNGLALYTSLTASTSTDLDVKIMSWATQSLSSISLVSIIPTTTGKFEVYAKDTSVDITGALGVLGLNDFGASVTATSRQRQHPPTWQPISIAPIVPEFGIASSQVGLSLTVGNPTGALCQYTLPNAISKFATFEAADPPVSPQGELFQFIPGPIGTPTQVGFQSATVSGNQRYSNFSFEQAINGGTSAGIATDMAATIEFNGPCEDTEGTAQTDTTWALNCIVNPSDTNSFVFLRGDGSDFPGLATIGTNTMNVAQALVTINTATADQVFVAGQLVRYVNRVFMCILGYTTTANSVTPDVDVAGGSTNWVALN